MKWEPKGEMGLMDNPAVGEGYDPTKESLKIVKTPDEGKPMCFPLDSSTTSISSKPGLGISTGLFLYKRSNVDTVCKFRKKGVEVEKNIESGDEYPVRGQEQKHREYKLFSIRELKIRGKIKRINRYIPKIVDPEDF